MRKAALLLALAVVLSGCGSLGGTGTQTPTANTPAQTVSPPVETTEEPTDVGGAGPTSQLFSDHLEALEEEGHLLTLNTSGQVESHFFEAASPSGLPILTTLNRSDGWSRTYYVDGERFGVTNRSGVLSLAQTSVEGGTFIPVFLSGDIGASPGNQRLAAYVLTVDYNRVGNRTIDGTTYTVYEASGTGAFVTNMSEQALPPDRGNVTEFSSRLLVDQNGVIRQYRGTYEYPDSTLRVNASVSNVGEIRVQQPSWVPAACRSTDFDAISVDCEQGLEN